MKKRHILLTLLCIFIFKQSFAENAKEDNKEANQINELIQSAENGSVNSLYILAGYYLKKSSENYDEKKALNYLEKAAKKDHLEAQILLGLTYIQPDKTFDQIDIKQDLKRAEKLVRAAANQGSFEGLLALAEWYSKTQKHKKAFKLYEEVAAHKDPIGELYMGTAYNYGRGVKANDSKAFEWYLKSAKNGNINAQSNVGTYYKQGKGVEKNITESLKWHKSAAAQGSAIAQFNMGVNYLVSYGVVQDFSKAVEYLSLSAQQGIEPACKTLEQMKVNGDGGKDVLMALSHCM